MGFMEAIQAGIQKYADFGTRSSRSEYWFWVLGYAVGYVALVILSGILGWIGLGFIGMLLFGIYGLGMIVPSLAVTVRRLHDVGRSGWFVLLALIPVIGAIILLVWEVTAGQPEKNQWGENPLGRALDQE